MYSLGEVPICKARHTTRTHNEDRRRAVHKLVDELKKCGKTKDLERGKLLHNKAIEAGCHKNRHIAHTLISMYSKCGSTRDARDVFQNMSQHDVVSWTALIVGYMENGESLVALELFNTIDCPPDAFIFAAAVKACTSLVAHNHLEKTTCLHKGIAIHTQARECGFEKDVFIASALIDMYGKCGSMLHAKDVFDGMQRRDVVTWTALILGYVENGECLKALNVFASMSSAPNDITFVAVLKACAGLASLDKRVSLQKGIHIHMQARERGFDKYVFVASALVDMYSKCGSMLCALDVFEKIVHRDTVCWTALMLGYVENGESFEALDAFVNMECTPNSFTFVVALKACTNVGSLDIGQGVHSEICRLGVEQDEVVANSLVDLYGKCSNMCASEEVFNTMHTRNTVSWTALIGGYTSVGNTYKVFSVVKSMHDAGVELNGVTIQLILTACSHAGMVKEGQRCFQYMSRYRIRPTAGHYTCMIDMLGRANRLEEALSMVYTMPFEADSVVWMTLLGACRKWKNVEVGKVAFRALVKQDKDREDLAGAYVMMAEYLQEAGHA